MRQIFKIITFILCLVLFLNSLSAQDQEELDKELIYSIEQGNLTKVESLLSEGANIEVRWYYEEVTPLILAAFKGKIEIVRFLLSKGVNIEAVDYKGNTALNLLAGTQYTSHMTSDILKIISILISKGANIETRDYTGSTPISNAAKIGNDVVMLSIIVNGAHLDTQDNQGKTPLHWAVLEDNPSTVKLLLSMNAKCCLKDKVGNTPYDYSLATYNRVIELILLPVVRIHEH
jgi:ankyrin repeat protein